MKGFRKYLKALVAAVVMVSVLAGCAGLDRNDGGEYWRERQKFYDDHGHFNPSSDWGP